MDVTRLIQKSLKENPEIQLVLELASRAHEMEAKELPRHIGMATEIVAIPTNSQCLVPLVIAG